MRRVGSGRYFFRNETEIQTAKFVYCINTVQYSTLDETVQYKDMQYRYFNLQKQKLKTTMAPPPPRRPKSVTETAAHRFPDKDQAKINLKLIRSTDALVRQLGVKVTVGRLGKGDSAENRAAILLNREVNLDMAKLAMVCLTSKKDITSLANKVANHMDSCGTSSQKQHSGRRQRGNDPSISTMPVGQESFISTLSIRLGSLIPDSHGFAKRTEKLLDDMQHHIQRAQNKYERDASLNDIRRKRTVYEAVCFYILAEDNQLTKDGNLKETLLEATKVRETDFTSVYEEAKKFYVEMKQIHKTKRAAGAPERGPPKDRSQKKMRTGSNKTVTEVLGLVASSNSNIPGNKEQETPQSNEKLVYSESFKSWKAKTLEEALKQTREGEEELSDSQALHRAADLILSKRSLLT